MESSSRRCSPQFLVNFFFFSLRLRIHASSIEQRISPSLKSKNLKEIFLDPHDPSSVTISSFYWLFSSSLLKISLVNGSYKKRSIKKLKSSEKIEDCGTIMFLESYVLIGSSARGLSRRTCPSKRKFSSARNIRPKHPTTIVSTFRFSQKPRFFPSEFKCSKCTRFRSSCRFDENDFSRQIFFKSFGDSIGRETLFSKEKQVHGSIFFSFCVTFYRYLEIENTTEHIARD